MLIVFLSLYWLFPDLILNLQKAWLNLQLCGRNPLKSVLFICPSACLNVCDAFSSGSTLWIFKIFCTRIFLPYALKSDQVIICCLVSCETNFAQKRETCMSGKNLLFSSYSPKCSPQIRLQDFLNFSISKTMWCIMFVFCM